MEAPLFGKILIANRGEIACRIISSCKKLNIKTVAICSTAEMQSMHAQMADETICVGPPPARESYMCPGAVIEACLKAKVDAVHPGYGFLAENSAFCREVLKNNIVFIGPSPEAIDTLGDKINAKKLAIEANVQVVPGTTILIESHEQLLQAAHEIHYPVMIKPSCGGGGMAMSVAHDDEECIKAYESCKKLAESIFHKGDLLLEKYISRAKHIEIPVVADHYGNYLYFPERECSVQRRNQKVIEETPSMVVTAETRKLMGEQAVAMARHANFTSAGTVENIFNATNQAFFFNEMNTRLQVEHCITEMTTGVDMVELMIRIAAGLRLKIKQKDLKQVGHAVECRIYAEDPTKKNYSSSGRLIQYMEPIEDRGRTRKEGGHVMVQSGVKEGSDITSHYDPLISKVITWGEDRETSLARMRMALDQYVIKGVKTNKPLLRDVVSQPHFLGTDYTTHLLDELYPEGFKQSVSDKALRRRLMATTCIAHLIRSHALDVKKANEGNVLINDIVVASIGATTRECETVFNICQLDAKNFQVSVISEQNTFEDMGIIYFDWISMNYPLITTKTIGFGGDINGCIDVFQYHGTDEVTYNIECKGCIFEVNTFTTLQGIAYGVMPDRRDPVDAQILRSPMPGLVIEVKVKAGEEVLQGTELMTIECMKMRNCIKSERDGVVKVIYVEATSEVQVNDLLVEYQ